MAAVGPAELRVGLCGRTARVELRSDEGLGVLRDRVAGAFGLTAPFDLVNPLGVPMRSDADAPVSRVGGAVPEVTVDAGEEILLDLERAHEETGAIRWVMLHKVLAGLRRQLAQTNASLADAQHRAAVLDEQLVRERSSREAGDGAARADLRCLAQRLEEEISRSRREAQTALETSAMEFNQNLQASLTQLKDECLQASEAVKQDLLDEREQRGKVGAEAFKNLETLRTAIQQEAEARAEAVQQAASSTAAVQAAVEDEKRERLSFQERAQMQVAEVGVRITEEQSMREHDLRSVQGSLSEARAALHAEGVARADALEAASRHIQQMADRAESRLTAHEAELEQRLSTLGALEGTMHTLVDREKAQREVGLTEMARSLEDLSKRLGQVSEESSKMEVRLQKADSDAAANAETGRRLLNDKLDEQAQDAASILERLHVEERCRATDVDALRREDVSLQEALQKQHQAFQDSCSALSASERSKREEGMEEMRRLHAVHAEEQREWARLLIDQVSKDLRVEAEGSVKDALKQSEDLVKQATERVREQVMAEVNRIESSAAELIRSQNAAQSQERTMKESQAQHTANEVRECLKAHSEFMEALEREQHILITRLNEGLAVEDSKREELGGRARALELDMQKVRGHLPILFAAPTAFR